MSEEEEVLLERLYAKIEDGGLGSRGHHLGCECTGFNEMRIEPPATCASLTEAIREWFNEAKRIGKYQRTNYAQRIVDELRQTLSDCDETLLNHYALLVMSRGTETTLEDVHNAWSLWRMQTDPDHPMLIPFELVPEETKKLDRKYRDTIADVACTIGSINRLHQSKSDEH